MDTNAFMQIFMKTGAVMLSVGGWLLIAMVALSLLLAILVAVVGTADKVLVRASAAIDVVGSRVMAAHKEHPVKVSMALASIAISIAVLLFGSQAVLTFLVVTVPLIGLIMLIDRVRGRGLRQDNKHVSDAGDEEN